VRLNCPLKFKYYSNHFFHRSSEAPQTIPQEDSSRTQYQPQLRILKRPSAEKSPQRHLNNFKLTLIIYCNACSQERSGPARPIKTLEEREAAYAEARLRILGPQANNEAAQPSDKLTLQNRNRFAIFMYLIIYLKILCSHCTFKID
jgi:hypothetical protein